MNSPSRHLFSYYASMFCVGLLAACLGPALPTFAANTHSTLQQVSLILAMRPAGYLAGTLLAGRMLDRMPGHPILIAALVLAASAMVLAPQMQSLGALTALVLALGFGDGALDVGTNTLLPWVYGDAAGPYFIGLHFVFGLGALGAPIIIGRALSIGAGTGSAFVLMGLMALPALVALYLLPSPQHLPQQVPLRTVPEDHRVGPTRVLLVVLIFLAYGGSEAAFGAWIFSYAKALRLADDAGAAYLTGLFWGSLTAGRLLSIPLTLRYPLPRILRLDALGCLFSVGLLLAFPHSKTCLWAATTGAGLSMASFFPTLVVWAGRQLSPSGRVSSSLTSLFFVGSSCGAILLPWLIGQGFESYGPFVAPALIGVSVFLMGIGLSLHLSNPSRAAR